MIVVKEKDPALARHIGSRLRSLREAREWRLERLAVESDIPYPTIARIERGESTPRVVHLRQLAAALDVSLDDLAGGEVGS